MIIKSLKINNLQLIKSAQVDFDKINIISGINKDSPSESGNGSGKSTLCLTAILFGLYGYCSEGIVIKDLIRFGEKECSVELTIVNNNEQFVIVRKIPSELQVFYNGEEIQANTATIKQQFINEHFGDVNFFRQYRCVDNRNGINLLDMGIVSVRKTLMGFIESLFSDIRTRLLAQKVERERYSVDKKLYKHYLSVKRLDLLNASLDVIKKDYQKFEKDKDLQQGIIGQIKSEISSREKIIYYKQQEMKKIDEGICPVLKIQCEKIAPKNKPNNLGLTKEIDILKEEIKGYKSQLESEEESIGYYDDTLAMLRNKEQKAREKLMRLKGAFQFVDYKYTKADIVIYDEAIKVLDTFAGEYIKEWLSSLSVIINNLLQSINISVEFTADKDFLHVFDNQQMLKYDMLSTGQKCFLSVIFKLAILMQQNKTGIVLMDDGLNNLDNINLTNLITICQTLPFQIIAVYQSKVEIEDVKQFTVVRQNGISNII